MIERKILQWLSLLFFSIGAAIVISGVGIWIGFGRC